MIEDWIARIWENLGDRIGGPLSFRLILQPVLAIISAVRAGLHDAQAGRPPYSLTILTDAADRRELLQEGWKAVARIFVLSVAIDIVYQVIVFHWVYPFELLLIAFLLACVPYVAVRGPVNRLVTAARRRVHP